MADVNLKRLGELLVDFNFITEDQFQEALEEQGNSDKKLGQLLVDLGYLSEKDLIQVLEFQMGIPHAKLSNYVLNPHLAQYIPENIARRDNVVPLEKNGDKLKVAMTDPSDLVTIDDIEISSNLKVEPLIATHTEIENAIEQIYMDSIDKETEIFDSLGSYESDEEPEIEQLREMVEDAPIVQLANMIISKAYRMRASDIHIEPQENKIRIRYRIDGVLNQQMSAPKTAQAALISRLKIMADLDITERRIPQDGRIKMEINGQQVDMRFSTLPTIYGEKVVIRLLNKDDSLLDIRKLGFSKTNLSKYENLINNPNGIILVTGPTGSGKSTTLFATLNRLNTINKNIITIEDPVEYELKGINQVHARSNIGLTFAKTLRSILRQDPDIIMIGEIRDEETAEIAIRAALTGHLVLSTLHTNDAVSSIMRLVDMGVPPYLVSASLIGVLSQRLVRKICDKCSQQYQIGVKEKEFVGNDNINYLYKGTGCSNCNKTGYKGRLAVHELLVIDDQLKEMISQQEDVEQIKKHAIAQGMITLKEDGLEKLSTGLTTIKELRQIVI